jgi:multiple sugar transport system substrate-binding protein
MAPFYIQQGVLKELDSTEFELDKFYDPLKNAFVSEGKFYAVSKDYSTLALYYNKKFVNAADIPTTYETLYGTDYLTTLEATLPEGVVAMTYNLDLARQLYMAEANGASIIKDEIFSNLADPAVSANLKLELDAAIAGKIVTTADIGMGWNGDAFGNEKTAIIIEGNWVLGFLQQNFPDVDFGVLEVPTMGGKKGTMVFTVGYGINVKTKNDAASTAFVKFATGTVGMPIWTKGAGVLPSRSDVAEATKVGENPLLIPHIAGAAYATPWQKGTTMDTINNEYRNYLVTAVRGEATLSAALKKAQDEANLTIIAN